MKRIIATLIKNPHYEKEMCGLRPHLHPKYDVIFGDEDTFFIINKLGLKDIDVLQNVIPNIKSFKKACKTALDDVINDWEKEAAQRVISSKTPHKEQLKIQLEREKMLDTVSYDAVNLALEKIDQLKVGNSTWIKTGNEVIDACFDLEAGEITTIAAESGMGKTTLMIESIIELIKQDYGILINSMEISNENFLIKLACQRHTLNYRELIRGKARETDYLLCHSFIDSIKHIVTVCYETTIHGLQKQISKHRPRFVFNDFVNLFEGANDTSEMSKVQYELKEIAKHYSISIINLAQLNKATGNNAGKRPSIHNIQGAGATRQVSTVIVLLYYEGYYFKDDYGNPISDDIEIIIAKDRFGGQASQKIPFLHGKMTLKWL